MADLAAGRAQLPQSVACSGATVCMIMPPEADPDYMDPEDDGDEDSGHGASGADDAVRGP